MTRVMQLSDLHFGAEIPEAVEQLYAMTAELKPDRVLIGGDFTMRARRSEWSSARAFLDRLPCSTVCIPGNHDIPGMNHFWQRIFAPFHRYRQAISPVLEPGAVIGDMEVVGVNTSRRFGEPSLDWSLGSVSVGQCLRLPFRFHADTPFRAVMLHHPLRAAEGNERRLLKREGMLLSALERARVDLLLAGHFHQSHTEVLPLGDGARDVVLSHVSTACSWRTKGEPPGFHLIEAGEGEFAIEKYTFDREVGRYENGNRQTFQKSANHWRTVDGEPA